MAKQKNRSEKVVRSKNNTQKKSNPFEVKVNKQKHHVLGRKIAKYDKGKPGVSRSKAIKKRNETLLVEYKARGKTNKFIDRRIGEYDSEMTAEDIMLQRFARERQKHHENSAQFRLDDGDEDDPSGGLTHYGQSLSEIEKFEDPRLSDDDDDETSGNIGAKMVANEHFGGFMTRKEEDQGRSVKTEAKSWKERMEEMIAQSKKAKYERQHEREMNMEETDKLDLAWKTLRSQIGGMKTSQSALDIEEESKKIDSYDLAVNELKFDLKATATDRMKTEEEVAAEEKADLEKFEKDRLMRMQGITNDSVTEDKVNHRGADDLDDIGFNSKTTGEAKKFHCSYKDGQLLKEDDEDEEDEDEEDEEDDDDDDISSNDEVDESSEEEDDAMERTSDLESDEESEGEEEEEEEESKIPKKTSKAVKFSEKLVAPQSPAAIQEMLKNKKKVMDKARAEIPYTFTAPSTFNDLCDLLTNHPHEDQVLILQRLRKCHHPSLAAGNKAVLQVLFSQELHYYGMLARLSPPSLRLAETIYPELDTLARLIGASETANTLNSIIESMYEDYSSSREISSLKMDKMMMFMLAEKLFCVSDLKHAVTTQILLFMSETLAQGTVKSTNDITKGLLICEIIFKYTNECKRFVPEVLNFLSGVLYLGYEQGSGTSRSEVVIPPFRTEGKYSQLLTLQSKKQKFDFEVMNIGEVISTEVTSSNDSDQFKVNLLHWTYRLIKKYSQLYDYLPCYKVLFSPILARLRKQARPLLKGKVKAELVAISELIKKSSVKKMKPLVTAKAKPKLIELFEPLIADSFDGRKQHNVKDQSKEFNEKQKMMHKVKREMKSAVREIKRDNEFLARRKIDDQIERDNERKQKVKRLYHLLSTQEGDHNAMQRKKHKS